MLIARESSRPSLTLGGTVLAAAPASAGVDDFTFDSFTADYYLDVDAEGHSTLTTVETLVAQFPDFDQNQGVLRYLPEDYQGHPTDIPCSRSSTRTATRGRGPPSPRTGSSSMKLGEEGTYVHGKQTYVVTYTQKNVTQYFSNTDADEFYWDTNGTDWPQPFGVLTARVHVPAALAGRPHRRGRLLPRHLRRHRDLRASSGPTRTAGSSSR